MIMKTSNFRHKVFCMAYELMKASSSQESAGNTTAELLATKLEPYPYLVRNFVVRDSVTLLHAAKGIGKSMLAYSIAVAVV